MDRLIEMYEENEKQSLERKSVIQLLDLEGFDEEFVRKAIDEAIKEGTLYEPKPGFIKFTPNR